MPAIKYDIVDNLEAAREARFLFPVLFYRKEEYKIPEWVEEEDQKAKAKKEVLKRKAQKKQPVKNFSQENKKQEKLSAEESLLPNNQEENSSSSDSLASQVPELCNLCRKPESASEKIF